MLGFPKKASPQKANPKKTTSKAKPTNRMSAQQSIPYRRIYPDGICRVTHKFYSKTIQFYDINHTLLSKEDKRGISTAWRAILDYFDPNVQFQLTYFNAAEDVALVEKQVCMPLQEDKDDVYRQASNENIQRHLHKTKRRQAKGKYLTFGLEAENVHDARAQLNMIADDIHNGFHRLKIRAHVLDGKERLHLMRDMMAMDCSQPFHFSWQMLKESGLHTKDFIAPSSFNFHSHHFRLDDKYARTATIMITSQQLNESFLQSLLAVNQDIIINFHITPVEHGQALRNLRRKLSDTQTDMVNVQKGATSGGYDWDMAPAKLRDMITGMDADIKALEANENFFYVTISILYVADDLKTLNYHESQIASIARSYTCDLRHNNFEYMKTYFSMLPLGQNAVEVTRNLDSTSLAGFMPFGHYDMFVTQGEPVFYGVNPATGQLVFFDRKLAQTPNGLVFGTPGSGKSFWTKWNIANVYLTLPQDDIIVCDPEGEYYPLVQALGGQVIRISATAKDTINLLDMSTNYNDDLKKALIFKVDFMLSIFQIILDCPVLPEEKSVIDACMSEIYKPYMENPDPLRIPILEDLYNALGRSNNPYAAHLQSALEIYVHGSMRMFNNRTNVDIHNRLICFDIKDLGTNIKTLGMMIVQDHVWNRITVNRAQKKSTWYYIDEFHLLLRDEQTAAFSVEIWKRFRKWGGIPTGITQNVSDVINSVQAGPIFENSKFIQMFNQGAKDLKMLSEQLNISAEQQQYLVNANEGEGLLYYEGNILPVENTMSKDNPLYKILTTKPREVE